MARSARVAGAEVSDSADGAAQSTSNLFSAKASRVQSTASALRWSAVSLIGRQAVQMVSAVLLARILGPEAYGVTAMVSIYAALTLIVLDQGLALALIQKDRLAPGEPGAAASVNIGFSLLLGLVTVWGSGAVADFFNTPGLAALLTVLGWCLVFKGVAIVPRAMLSRHLEFRPIAYSDILGATLGAILGIGTAMAGFGSWSVIIQIVVTDVYVAIAMLVAGRGPAPNFRFGLLRGLFVFSVKIFVSNLLQNTARRIDDILVGRFLGATQLAFYGLAYKVLMFPVQLLGGVLNRAIYPLIARRGQEVGFLDWIFASSTRMLTCVSVPGLTLVILLSPICVPLVLGEAWIPAVPVVQILAISGMRQCVFAMTGTLMIGLGRAGWQLRFSFLAVSLQVLGIVVGLRYGIVGVATGYTIGTLVVVPILLWIQEKLVGMSWAGQFGLMWPALHGAGWGAIAFLLVRAVTPAGAAYAGVALLAFTATFLLVMGLVHRPYSELVLRSSRILLVGVS